MITVSEPYYKVVGRRNIDLARGVYFRRVPLRLVVKVDLVPGIRYLCLCKRKFGLVQTRGSA